MRGNRGFTLIELIISLILVGVLAAFAYPAYSGLMNEGRYRAAGADLLALGIDMEKALQRNMRYPAVATRSTAETIAASIDWLPSQGDYFNYTLSSDPYGDDIYTLSATGIGIMEGCNLSLTASNRRTISPACGAQRW